MTPEQIYWVWASVELSVSLVCLVLPCWYLLWRWRSEHHLITTACLLLLIPDLFMIADFLPKHIADSVAGHMVTGGTCTASAFLTCASILASNGGGITVAYVTKRMLDPKDQKVAVSSILTAGAVSWTLGIALASYFYARGYLGSHRGVYCCTVVVAQADVAGPVFLCFAVSITAMTVLYSRAYKQVKLSVLPQHGQAGKREISSYASEAASGSSTEEQPAAPTTNLASPSAANKSRTQQQPASVAADGPSPLGAAGSRNVAGQAKRVGSASSAVARRGTAMVLVYYGCWSLVTLNAVFELAGWNSRSTWWDITAALLAKAQPGIDAAIMIHSMWKVHERRQALKARTAAAGPLSPGGRSVSRPAPLPISASVVRQRPGKSKPTSPVGGGSVLVKEKTMGGERVSQISEGSDGPDSSVSHRRVLSAGAAGVTAE